MEKSLSYSINLINDVSGFDYDSKTINILKKPKAKAKATQQKPKAKATKTKSNLGVAIHAWNTIGANESEEKPSQLSPESVPHKGGTHW